ncbi:hypothetical protein F4811DRAFT_520543 [Daldinia bambusicola]|nr:hypothetical protein F4811DRAFT_520543 [Daldinia bambusicola]
MFLNTPKQLFLWAHMLAFIYAQKPISSTIKGTLLLQSIAAQWIWIPAIAIWSLSKCPHQALTRSTPSQGTLLRHRPSNLDKSRPDEDLGFRILMGPWWLYTETVYGASYEMTLRLDNIDAASKQIYIR